MAEADVSSELPLADAGLGEASQQPKARAVGLRGVRRVANRRARALAPAERRQVCVGRRRAPHHIGAVDIAAHAIAIAIAEALEDCGLKPQIKWPNDIYLSGRKVCGILLETAGNAQGMFVVIGFGLNVNLRTEEFPDELAATATSLFIETERIWDRDELLRSILAHLLARVELVETNFPHLLAMAEARSFLRGHRVTLRVNDTEERGLVHGLSPNGGLLFEGADGQVREILTADVVRRVES